MRINLLTVILTLTFLLNGCNSKNNECPLEFFQIGNEKVEILNPDDIKSVVKEKIIDKGVSAFIFIDRENNELKGSINLNGKYYYVGQVSMENTPEDLIGIEEVQVFGKKAVKIYGILGANYAQVYYWFFHKKPEESIIQINGNAIEIDLDDDGKNEIVSTLGTVSEARIYILKEGRVYASDINESIGAESVVLKDTDKKLLEVYFEPNKPEQYIYHKGSLIKK